MVIYSSITATVLLAAATAPLAGQSLGLAEAWRRAGRSGYANRAAAAEVRVAGAEAAATLRGVLPSLRAEAGWLRTTDPVATFGTTLRQRAVSAAAFAPSSLNNPAPTSDLAAATVVEIPLFMPGAWAGRTAARRAADAAEAASRWTAQTTRVEVTRGYFGAVLAQSRVATLEAALAAAQNHVRAAEALVRGGVALRSDALLAAVKAGEIEADLARARADALLARAGLALLLGDDTDTAFSLPADFPGDDRLHALPRGAEASRPRADVEAADLALAAARAGERRARTLLLPSISAFARYDWHARSSLFGGRPMWTAGVMAGWSLFSGGQELAENRAASARRAGAAANAEAAEAGARLDVARREADLGVALQRLGLASRAVTQSTEAHRLVARKYEGGLAAVGEVLDAAAIETASRLRHAASRYDVIAAAAALLQARGLPLDPLLTLDEATP